MKWDRILVAINDSEPATWAAQVAVDIAEQLSSQILVLHVVNRAHVFATEVETPSSDLLAELRKHGQELLERTVQHIPHSLHPQTLLREGRPADEIIAAAAEHGAQLVVLGTHARSRLSHLLLGSTAEAVVRQSPCAVLTVRNKPGNGNGHSTVSASSVSTTKHRST